MKNSKNFGLSVGYSSILIVFIILVFVAFSTLSYKQAQTSLKRVDHSIDILEENYVADTKAMEIRLEIDRILAQSENITEAYKTIQNSVSGINLLDNVAEYTIIINDKAQLKVKLCINATIMKSEVLCWVVETINQDEYSQKGFNF
ncbi:hypothetical protein [Anaerorhabdus sp.]|uniref:hypothetical protein n=1 Tax=Anaerorhabdus sp. TaxID=1872524 RepID=UPI002FC73D4A